MNFGIVGCGVIARTHAGAIEQIEGATLYAVCDIIKEKADDFAALHGVEKVYYNYNELLKDPAVDIVCVCVPSGLHGEVAIAAANAKKAIVCEKPMEITQEKMEAICRAVDANGVKMQCIFQRRMMPVAQEIKKLIADGRLGRIVLADAYLKYYRDQAYYDSAGWRGTWELDGGGALMNQGVHGVDLILWMLGGAVKTIFGKAKTLARKIEVEDTAAALLQMEGGELCVMESTTSTYPGFSTTFMIYGTEGTVAFNDEKVLRWEFLDKEHAPACPGVGEAVGGASNPIAIGNKGHVRLLSDLMEALKEDREPMIPPREAMTAVKVIRSIYESTKTGKEIHL